MAPPPTSLGAMVESGGRGLEKQRARPTASSLWVWAVVALATAALTAYLMR